MHIKQKILIVIAFFFKGVISVKNVHLVMREILKQFLVEPDSNHGVKN